MAADAPIRVLTELSWQDLANLQRAVELAQHHVNHELRHAHETSPDDMGAGVREWTHEQQTVTAAAAAVKTLALHRGRRAG